MAKIKRPITEQKIRSYTFWTPHQVAYLQALKDRDLISEAEAMRRILDKEINSDSDWWKKEPTN
jgi:hypothetical protein